MLKAISWNIGRRRELWRVVAESDVHIALLQEACEPPSDLASAIQVDSVPWKTDGDGGVRSWRTAVVRVGQRCGVTWYVPRSMSDGDPQGLVVSRAGTLAAATVRDPDTEELTTFVSLYATWERLHSSTAGTWIYADASAHRLISDVSALIGRIRRHRIIVAGDFNILYGYGEHGNEYWAGRYQTVFDRMHAVGLRFVGPQAPGGRQADPWPVELPKGSLNVPTYYTAQQTLSGATRQLDFVFASTGIAGRVRTRALNLPEEWGGSDHCPIEITVT